MRPLREKENVDEEIEESTSSSYAFIGIDLYLYQHCQIQRYTPEDPLGLMIRANNPQISFE